jgi:Txe/YoeB family toxin of Txe-Axe toxin-antitoxin module
MGNRATTESRRRLGVDRRMKLVGDLADAYSRRINIQHRLVYHVLEPEHVVKVLRL